MRRARRTYIHSLSFRKPEWDYKKAMVWLALHNFEPYYIWETPFFIHIDVEPPDIPAEYRRKYLDDEKTILATFRLER